MQNVVSTKWLAANLGAADLVVFDCSTYLPNEAGNKKDGFREAHIPGALLFDIDAIADTETDLPHMVPTPGRFAKLVGALGVSNASRIVFYDQHGLRASPRGWWMMRLFGHDNAAVLDGGLPAWKREGRPVETGEAAAPAPAVFVPDFRAEKLRGIGDIKRIVRQGGGAELIIDARAKGRFDGTSPELARWIERVMDEHRFSYEVLFIDDGSSDHSWDVIEGLSAQNPALHGLRFSRNYGKSAALHTGFQAARGSVIITMDADLQDSPDEIPELYRLITEEKYDLVSGWKKVRYDPPSKTIPTKLFNAAARAISGLQLHDFNCGLKAYRRPVAKSLRVYGELHRWLPVLAKWNGFTRIGEKVVQHRKRQYGYTKFGLERFLYGFLDLLTISFVNRFGKRPMHLFGAFGVLSFFVGTVMTIWLASDKIYSIYTHQKFRNLTDDPKFFLALIAIVVGVQLFLAGFLGELLTTNSERTTEYQVRETTDQGVVRST